MRYALLLLAILVAPLARAQQLSMGPTIPLTQVRFAGPSTGKPEGGLLSAGAGYQLSVNYFDRLINGKAWSLLTVGGMAFGTIGTDAGAAWDTASIALSVGTLNNLVSIGFGCDLISYYAGTSAITGQTGQVTGLLAGNVTRGNLFGLLALSFNFEVGPYTPPQGTSEGTAGYKRANTIYF